METKPYQMVDATIAIMGMVARSLERGATVEAIVGAIIREGDLACKEFRLKPSSKGPDVWRTC